MNLVGLFPNLTGISGYRDIHVRLYYIYIYYLLLHTLTTLLVTMVTHHLSGSSNLALRLGLLLGSAEWQDPERDYLPRNASDLQTHEPEQALNVKIPAFTPWFFTVSFQW